MYLFCIINEKVIICSDIAIDKEERTVEYWEC